MSFMENACQGMAEYCGAEIILAIVREDELKSVEPDVLICYESEYRTALGTQKLNASALSKNKIYEQLTDFLVE